MKHHLTLAAGLATLGSSAMAADVQLKFELPRINVAEYHKPYVAIWVEKPGANTATAQLAVWYDLKKPNNGGTKWVRDMRQWWRAGGRSMTLPVDGVSGATRAPGEHVINLSQHPALASLPAGSYELVVEVSREAGGREVRRLPFTWPVKSAAEVKVQGDDELGALQLNVKP
ncbi:MAG: DUF2271 domain-containing protein [Roseateles depolymerans]|uniref:DUF2271 domain-containing protein n=1 Tax=Roseateles depolymerans TaxID=76731 RepID=A0A2W5DQB4_9BURK|nr:MAG: DUF2271 domain-containing protein [Roseateles depolymerans]